MKYIHVILLSLLNYGIILAQPQDRQGPPRLPDSTQIAQMVDEMVVQLSLNQAQKQKISQIYYSHFKEAKILRDQNKAEHEKNRKAMEALRKGLEDQVTAEIGEDKRADFQSFMESKHPKKGERKGPPKK